MKADKNRHVFDNFRCAGRGLWHALKTQRTMRIHVAAAFLVAAAALAFMWLGEHFEAVEPVTPAELALLLMTIANVLVVEMINTGIEHLVRALHPQEHPLLGAALDISAGAVLVASILAAIVGLIIFVPRAWGVGASIAR